MTDLFLQPLFTWRSAIASPFGPENPTTRLVLLTLALHMNEKGESCFPSIDRLVDESGLSRRAVIQHLQIAADTGWIGKRERRQRNGQGWRIMEYIPLIPAGVEQAVRDWDEQRRRERLEADPFHGKQGGASPAPCKDGASPAPCKDGAPDAPREGGARHSEGGARHSEGGARHSDAVHDVHPSTSKSTSKSTSGNKGGRRRAAPSAVSAAFKRYAENIKAKYSADYPPSARANGQLANVIARVGAEPALAVIDAYFASSNTFYAKVRHSLNVLVKDCERIWLDLQASTGQSKPVAPKHALVQFLHEDGTVMKDIGPQPLGAPFDVAKHAVLDYGRFVAAREPRHVAVRIGAERHVFSVEELRREVAHA